MLERFDDCSRTVMKLANEEARRFNHEYIGTEHLLLGLIKEGSGLAAQVLQNLNIDLRQVRIEIEQIVQSGPDMVTTGKLPQTPRAKKVIEYAIEEARNLNHNHVGTEHLLLGLLREDQGVAGQVLMDLGLTAEMVRQEILLMLGEIPHLEQARNDQKRAKKGQSRSPILDKYGRDLTELARRGELDPVIGREQEIEQLLVILYCRQRNSPLLVGQPGVGKSALVHGLAQRLADGSLSDLLGNRRLVGFDLAQMLGDIKDWKEFGRSVQKIVGEVRRSEDILMLLEDVHLLCGQSNLEILQYAIRIFKASLGRWPIQCLATTTPDEYHALAVKDSVLRHQFQPIYVQPTSKEVTLQIVRGLQKTYEDYHHVQFTEGALKAIVDFAERHTSERAFPGKAENLLDQAGAFLALRHGRLADCREMDTRIKRLNREKEDAVAEQQFDQAIQLREQADKIKKQKEDILREWEAQKDARDLVVDEAVVAEVASRMTGPRGT
jgi:ATP-dependent Clp protease ATP-binding subunit ClpC